jgi:hypothetical protein
VTVPEGRRPRMSAAVGIPDGGIAQPAMGRRLRTAKIDAIGGERMNLAPERMAIPLSSRRRPAHLDGLTDLSAGCQRSLDLATLSAAGAA